MFTVKKRLRKRLMSLKKLQSVCKIFIGLSPQTTSQIVIDVVFFAGFDYEDEIYRNYITFQTDKEENYKKINNDVF